jgi:hypothetical protein
MYSTFLVIKKVIKSWTQYASSNFALICPRTDGPELAEGVRGNTKWVAGVPVASWSFPLLQAHCIFHCF